LDLVSIQDGIKMAHSISFLSHLGDYPASTTIGS
jgi:hypothetical protein